MPFLVATVPTSTQAATPVFSPASGTYSGGHVSFTLSCATPGASIYYTSDGSTPSATNGILYTVPVNNSALGTTTFKAVAVAAGYANSQVASVIYTVVIGTASSPTYLPAAGSYSAAQNVVASSTTPGATIWYTTDGTTPVPA